MQLYTIKNEYLQIKINPYGACLWSIQDARRKEYLWQGNPEFWEDKAPNLFPYIARLTEGKYLLDGKIYEMNIHGFAKDTLFDVEQITEQSIIFRMTDSDETYRQYPYRFVFEIRYDLDGKKVYVSYQVKNMDEKRMCFGVGGHPGFCVPLEENLAFEDYYLEFRDVTDVKRVGFSEDCFVDGTETSFELVEGRKLFLKHNLFDEDAIVLKNMAKEVCLKSETGRKGIRVEYPDMEYLGIWHWPKTKAPYVCIEPWSTLPSRKDRIEDLAKQPDMIKLEPNKQYKNQWIIEIMG